MSELDQECWYYSTAEGRRLGPVSIRELGALARQGGVRATTLVWCHGYKDWIPAEEISELLAAAQGPAPTRGESSSPQRSAGPHAGTTSEETLPIKSPEPTGELPEDIKPRKGSFLFRKVVLGGVSSGLLGAITAISLAAAERSPLPALAVLLLGCGLAIYSSLVAYRKERYQIHESRVVCHRGGLMSDETTELEIRNITQVKIKLPWLRHKFFGIGDVVVESAGDAKPVIMRVIREPEAVYTQLRERMQKNGYSLTQSELLHEEKPAIIGIVGECLGMVIGVVMAGLFALPIVISSQEGHLSQSLEVAAICLAVIIALTLVSSVIIRVLDLRRRTYRVYNDAVVYDEGFLTRENTFIPYENIADSSTKSSFFDQIFGLYDVQVSCQGSGSEIKFRRLANGVALSAVIDQLVVNAREKPKPTGVAKPQQGSLAVQSRPRRIEPEAIPTGDVLVGDFKMNSLRTLAPLLVILPIFPVWLLLMIQAVVRISSTVYSVRSGSIRHTYRFFSLNEREFAYDKITGVVIKQNLLDRMLGTMTVRFWSIGSGQPIEFANVHSNQLDLPALMRQVGIPPSTPDPHHVDASVPFFTWLRARIGILPLLLLVAAGIIYGAMISDPLLYYTVLIPFALYLSGFFYARFYYSHQRLRFHDHHIEAERGVLSKRRYYARYSNIKRVRVTRYPGSEYGSLEIFVAGEEEATQLNNKQQRSVMRPCSFTSGFLPEVRGKARLLDDILCGRVDPTPDAAFAEPMPIQLEATRSVGTAVATLIVVSVIIFPLILLLPFTIPYTMVAIRRWRYRIETARIVMSWGILYRSEMSILLDRIDSHKQSQGPINKLFKNGNVSVMTAGSSRPDLNIVDTPSYLEISTIIREQTQ